MQIKKILAKFLAATTFISSMNIGNVQMVQAASTSSSSQKMEVSKTKADKLVIPDKCNTGITIPESKLTKVSLGGSASCKIDGVESQVQFKVSGNKNAFNWGTSNFKKGTYIFENLNFEDSITNLTSSTIEGNVEVIFNNCKFKGFTTNSFHDSDNMSFTFNNCTFESAGGSDVTFNSCYFGGGIKDRLNLYSDADVNNCYIANPTSNYSNDGEIHVDGVQIFGDTRENLPIGDIHFKNVRFEMPSCKYPNASKTYVNACIMLQMEYSSIDNVAFEDCYVDGGGYSIFCRTTEPQYSIQNTYFKDITFGGAEKYGHIMSDKSADVNYNTDTWKDADTAYVGTVNKGDDKITFYASNDTNEKRYLKAVTSTGNEYKFVMDAMPTGNKISNYEFEDLPIDVEYSIPESCDWVVIYDVTESDNNPGTKKYTQIRYMNWSDSNAESKTVEISNDDMQWSIEDGTLTIDSWGKMGDYSLVGNVPNTPWYDRKDEIKKIVIKKETENIGAYAFYGLDKLTDITIEGTLSNIGTYAFANCSALTSTEFLKEQSEINTLNQNVFKNCTSLENVYIPKNINRIGINAFAVDSSLSKTIKSRNLYYEGTRYEWNEYVVCERAQPNDIYSNPLGAAPGCMYENYTDLVTSYDLDEALSTKINTNAFTGCKSLIGIKNFDKCTLVNNNALRNSGISGNIVIEKDTEIQRSAFQNSDIESVTWKSSKTTTLPQSIFADCKKLTTFDATNSSLVETGIRCFENADALTTVKFPKNMKNYGSYLFNGCTSLISINIEDYAGTKINSSCFTNTNLATITIPNTVTAIDASAFSGCKMSKVKIPDSVVTIGNGAFSWCPNLESISFPDSVTSIGQGAISECAKLKSVRLSNNIETIPGKPGYGFFKNCSSLKTIIIPKAVKTIYTGAFVGCTSLEKVYIPKEVENINTLFYDTSNKNANQNLVVYTDASKDSIPTGWAANWNQINYNSKLKDQAISGDVATTVYLSEIPENTIDEDTEHVHNYNKQVINPTCTEDGYTIYTCSCGDTYKDNFITATGHRNTVIKNAVAPTCTKEGFSGDIFCNDCNTIITTGKILSKLPHTYIYGICNVCDAVKDASIDGLHYTVIKTDDGTHKASVRADDISGNVVIPSEIIIDGEKYTVTEIEDNGFANSKIDSIILPDTIEKIGKGAFDGSTVGRIEFTGKNAPHMEDNSLSGIKENITIVVPKDSTGYEISAITSVTQHIYSCTVHDADCEHRGYTVYTCILCSDEQIKDYVDAKGHIYSNGIVTKAANCKNTGIKEYECIVCHEKYAESIPKDASNHIGDIEIRNKKAATCSVEGYTGDTYCKSCNSPISKGTIISKENHNYNKAVTNPSCTAAGYTTYTCKNCGYSYVGDETPATPHTFTTIVKDATCIENGYTTHTCNDCGYTYTDNEIAAKGHIPGSPIQENISGPATFSSDKTCDNVKYCTICGVELSRDTQIIAARIGEITIPKLIYTYTKKPITPAVTVKDVNGNIIDKSNYTVSYKNNKNIGKATINITFTNNYV